MAASNQPLAFASLLGGGVLLLAGISGKSLRDVFAGKASPFKGIATDIPLPQPGSSGTAQTAFGVPGTLGAGGYAFPVPPGQRFSEERTDRGQDFSTTPGGQVLSITNGVVTNGRTPLGSGPVIRVVGGPLDGKYIGYMHATRGLVRPGQRVTAGQPVAIAGGVGGGGPGHIEIYEALNAGGAMAAAHDSTHHAWTGDVIHNLLHMLDPHRVRAQPIISG